MFRFWFMFSPLCFSLTCDRPPILAGSIRDAEFHRMAILARASPESLLASRVTRTYPHQSIDRRSWRRGKIAIYRQICRQKTFESLKIIFHFLLANLKTLRPTRHSRDSMPGNDAKKTLGGYLQTSEQINARLNPSPQSRTNRLVANIAD